MKRLGKLLKADLQGGRLGRLVQEGEVFSRWPELVGEVIAQRARPIALRDGTLVLAVEGAAWANEFHLMKPRLLETLRRGGVTVKDLRFQVDRPEARRPLPDRGIAPAGPGPLPEISASEREALSASARRAIPDGDLADGWIRTLVALRRRQEAFRLSGQRRCRCGAYYPGDAAACPVCIRVKGR